MPAGGGVKADDYQDATATAPPTSVPAGKAPVDQRQYFDLRTKLLDQAKAAGEGTRTYDETWKQIEALNASMDGKEVKNWICIIPAGDGGGVRENMKSLGCTADGSSATRYNLFFDDPSILQDTTYPGDTLTISGTIENKGSGWIHIHPTAAAITEKSK